MCDADTIRRHKFLEQLIDYVEAKGLEWRSALEYLPDGMASYSPGALAEPPNRNPSKEIKAAKAKKEKRVTKKKEAKEVPKEETAEHAMQRTALSAQICTFMADSSRYMYL